MALVVRPVLVFSSLDAHIVPPHANSLCMKRGTTVSCGGGGGPQRRRPLAGWLCPPGWLAFRRTCCLSDHHAVATTGQTAPNPRSIQSNPIQSNPIRLSPIRPLTDCTALCPPAHHSASQEPPPPLPPPLPAQSNAMPLTPNKSHCVPPPAPPFLEYSHSSSPPLPFDLPDKETEEKAIPPVVTQPCCDSPPVWNPRPPNSSCSTSCT
ncbi:hypothetical protein BKA81DRAFT_292509 [Phyllosticta paracitricarpa]